MIKQLKRLKSCYEEATRVARELVERIKAGDGSLNQADLEKGLEIRAKALLSAQDLSSLITGRGGLVRFRNLSADERGKAGRLTAQARSQAQSALEAGAELFQLLSAEKLRTMVRLKAARNGQRLMKGYKGFKSASANLSPDLRG